MPNFPCAERSACECDESPFANLSAEAPDLPTFFSIGFQAPPAPLGSQWLRKGCMFICTSTVSQEAADLCAAREAYLCVTSGWSTGTGDETPSGPVPPPASTRGGVPYLPFVNSDQTCGIKCADGLTFFFTVPAGVFAGVNQAAADASAKSYACRQAQLRRVCLGTIKTPTCAGVPYAGTITASGKFLATGTQTNLWEKVAGTLPPGLTFNGGHLAAGSVTITGTPTTPGSYFFIVQVTDPRGDAMAKGYTLVIAGITNGTLPDGTVGAPYAVQLFTVGFTTPVFTLESGTLPDGLTLNAGGTIDGTPTTSGDSAFVVRITDSATGLSCVQSLAATVAGGCSPVPTEQFNVGLPGINFDGLAWRSNPPAVGPNNTPLLLACDLNGTVTSISLIDHSLVTLAPAGRSYSTAAYCPLNDKFVLWDQGGLSIVQFTPEPLAFFNSLEGVSPGGAITAIYSAATGLVYFNASANIVVYNPLTNTVLALISSGGIFANFAGNIAIDEVGKRLWLALTDSSGAVNEAYITEWDIASGIPVFVRQVLMPLDAGSGADAFSALWCPTNGLVYCSGNQRGTPLGDATLRYNPGTHLFTNIVFSGDTPGDNTTPIYSPADDLIYWPNALTGGADMICPATDAIIGSLTVTNPLQATLSQGGAVAYVNPTGLQSFI